GRRKELECRSKSNSVFPGEILLRQFLSVEIGDFAGADQIELQHFEILADVAGDRRIGKVHQMRLATIGATAQFPHNGQALAAHRRALQVLAQIEEALQEPGLVIKAIVSEECLGPHLPAACSTGCKSEKATPRNLGNLHSGSPRIDHFHHYIQMYECDKNF